MKGIIEIGKDLAKNLNGWQSLVILLFIIFLFAIIPVLGSMSQVEAAKSQTTSNNNLAKEFSRLSKNIEGRNVNNVDYRAACEIYEDVFHSSMCKITRMAMNTITKNHIDDPRRERWIRETYNTEIMAMYNDDRSTLNKIKYNNKRLGGVMVEIDPLETINSVLDIIFSPDVSHHQKLIDVDEELMNRSVTFLQLGINYLDEE